MRAIALLSEPGAPIGKERWAGAIDSVGSHTLANVLAQTRSQGTVRPSARDPAIDIHLLFNAIFHANGKRIRELPLRRRIDFV